MRTRVSMSLNITNIENMENCLSGGCLLNSYASGYSRDKMSDKLKTYAPDLIFSGNASLPKLYLGNLANAINIDLLEKMNIFCCVNCGNDDCKYLQSPKICYLNLNIDDNCDQNMNFHYFKDAIEFAHKAKRNNSDVLFHCLAGKSRSATILIGVLMYELNLNFVSAFSMVKERRKCIDPNLGFTIYLQNKFWEDSDKQINSPDKYQYFCELSTPIECVSPVFSPLITSIVRHVTSPRI